MNSSLTRRQILSRGLATSAGVSFSALLTQRAVQGDIKDYESTEGTAKGVIFIFMPGGMCHQETFDPKPFAPLEYRGPMGSVQTSLPGIRINETWKQTAQILDRITVCRSMTHGEAAHERGTHNMFCGYRPSPILNFPSMGSVIAHEYGPRNNLPQYVCIPNQPNTFAGTGYLSKAYAPFNLGSDPASNSFKVRDLTLPSGVNDARFNRRRKVLDMVNERFVSNESSDSLDAVDTFYERAYGMIASPAARDAFDLNKEEAKLRDEYGRNTAGARLLLARRLVEAGSRFVTVTYGSWDMHNNISNGIKAQVPAFDQAFARLIRDLDDRGLLDSTMVCIASEFGRSPKINASAGRDHWPKVSSVVLAGGGIKRGLVYGSSDSTASEPNENPLGVEDWATTIYDRIGIVADKELMAPGDRPVEIVNGGKVRKDLLA
ncbi:MAG TPA: DUF1501 domain-containing protein [Planctomycetes bacterium]|nr:DUF1501 domain-containing protein [Fuerstiella sp.]HIK94623.1 DUF1501 domain-containing protein [Planctomycetota bacterium]